MRTTALPFNLSHRSFFVTAGAVIFSIFLILFARSAGATAPPTNVGGVPSTGQTNTPVETFVERNFNEALAPATVTTTNVLLRTNTGNTQGGAPTGSSLCTSITLLASNTRIRCEHAPLAANTWHTFTITTVVTDTSTPANALAANVVITFQTSSFSGGAANNPPPFVLGSIPFPGSQLPVNGRMLVKFSQLMRAATDGSEQGSVRDPNNVQLFLIQNGAPTGANIFTSNTGWLWNPTATVLTIPLPSLTVNSNYRLTVKGGAGNTNCVVCVRSSAGIAFPEQDYIADFTAVAADTTPPTVLGSFPSNGATSIDRATSDFALTFNEPIDPLTVSTGTVKLYCNDTDTNAANGCDGTNTNTVDSTDPEITSTTTFFDDDLRTIHLSNGILGNNGAPTDNFIIRVVSGTSGLKDIVGNALGADILRTFSTSDLVNNQGSPTYDNAAPRILFANADNFGVFITFSEPMKFSLAANATESNSSGANDVNNLANWTVETSPDGTNFISLNLTGKVVFYEADTKTLIIDDLALPPGQTVRVTGAVALQDLSGNGLSGSVNTARGTVQSASDTGGQLEPGEQVGTVDFFAQGTDPIEVFPFSALAGATTRYHVMFRARQAVPAGGTIVFTFPVGFSFAGTCSTLPTDTPENNDVNGPQAGVVTFSGVACDSVARTVTLTVGGTQVQANDELGFVIQGIVNSTVPKDFLSGGYTVDIKTYNTTPSLLDSLNSLPFFIMVPGTRSISGRLFVDNGAGGGTANDGLQNGTEAGANGIRVCLGGPIGFACATTDANGDYSFTSLVDGFYHLNIPPITSGTFTGGPFFRDLSVAGANITGVNFPLQQAAAGFILDVYVSGGAPLANQPLDVFAFSSQVAIGAGTGTGGFVVRELTLDGAGVGTVQLPLTQGTWQVGVGPRMPKEPGAAQDPPDMNFLPPRPVAVMVAAGGVPDLCTSGPGAANELCFTLTAAQNQIRGKLVDGTGAAIPNAFVNGRPAFIESTTTADFGSFTETDVNGLFTLKVIPGSFLVQAFTPGMPSSNEVDCNVRADTGNSATDNNSTADVYCDGVLIVNNVAGFSGTSLSLANVTDDDLVLTISKGSSSIAGRVLDDLGNPLPFSHVQAMEVNSNGGVVGKFVGGPTDNSGNYTLYVDGGTQNAPKLWRVCAFAPGFGMLPCITVAIVTGQNLTGKNIQAVAANFVTVSGTVYADTNNNNTPDAGEGITGAFVMIFGLSGGNEAVTDASGNYSMKVASGTGYTIEGFVPGNGPTDRLSNQTLTSNATGRNLRLARPGTLVVYVCTLVDTNAAPSAGNGCGSNQITDAFVGARDATGRGHGTGSNTTAGRYEVTLPAGTYGVEAHNPVIGDIGAQANVVVTGGATTFLNFAPAARFTVSGTVTSSDTACIEGVTVMITNATSGRMIFAPAAANGTWSVTNVPNGTYEIIAGKPGCVDAGNKGSFIVASANITQAQDTDLARTMTKSNLKVTGRVFIDANGNQSADAGENVSFETVVFATSGTGKRVVTMVDLSQTGTANNFTLDLIAGTWTIQARSDGYESSPISLSLTTLNSSADLRLTVIAGYTRDEAQPHTLVPSRGGVIKNPDISTNFEVNIPPGALGTSSTDGSVLTHETTAVSDTDTQVVVGDRGVEVEPQDSSGQPISTISTSSGSAPTITMTYTDAEVTAAGGTEANIVIGSWSAESGTWDPLPTTCDTTNNLCTATIEHFSTFAPIVASAGAPATPTGLAAVNVSSGTVGLSWNASTGATSYNTYRSTDGVTFPFLSSVTATTLSVANQPLGTVLSFRVSAVGSGSAESEGSTSVSITLPTTTTAGGGGGGTLPSAVTTLTLTAPNGGEVLTAGLTTNLTWTSAGTGVSTVRLLLSSDSGLNFATTLATGESNDGSYVWAVPSSLSGSNFRVRIEGLNTTGSMVISDTSDRNFSVASAGALAPTPTPTAPAVTLPGALLPDVTTGARFDKNAATDAAPTVNHDRGLTSPTAPGAAPSCTSNTLIKGMSFSAVYYCGADGKRYVFPNERTFMSWYADFSSVTEVTDATLASISLGGVITYRPGVRMVKIESDPKVYAVAPGGLLRWVSSESLAASLYGPNWNRMIDDVPVGFFARYRLGAPITEVFTAASY